jgi:two-component system capsular synthesis response regulator RcsB
MEKKRTLLRLLIVDDFPAIIDRITRLLSPSALMQVVGNVTSTTNVEESVSVFQPHVVIMDLHVGHGATITHGIEAIARVKRAYPYVKVVVFTNFADVQYRKLSLAKGADFFLDKAFDSDRLIDVMYKIYQDINFTV